METIFDWLTIALFSGLIVLFLQRSKSDEPPDQLWHYLVASVGCAAANYFGNEGQQAIGILLIATVITFVWIVLKPLEGWETDK